MIHLEVIDSILDENTTLKAMNRLLGNENDELHRIIEEIPECVHGKCVPCSVEWVRRMAVRAREFAARQM